MLPARLSTYLQYLCPLSFVAFSNLRETPPPPRCGNREPGSNLSFRLFLFRVF